MMVEDVNGQMFPIAGTFEVTSVDRALLSLGKLLKKGCRIERDYCCY